MGNEKSFEPLFKEGFIKLTFFIALIMVKAVVYVICLD